MPIGIYIFKDISVFLTSNIQKVNLPNHSIDIEVDDITMKTKFVVMKGIIAITFDEKPFFCTILGFNPHWDYILYIE